jgi:hypothetical protein
MLVNSWVVIDGVSSDGTLRKEIPRSLEEAVKGNHQRAQSPFRAALAA